MARIPYVAPGGLHTPAVVERLYAEVRSLGRPVAHLYQILAHQPPALEAFLGMSTYVRNRSSLDPGLREMAVLATANAIGQDYELQHHRPVARRAGVAAEKIEAVASGRDGPLDPLERSVVAYARQVAARRDVEPEVLDRLREGLTDAGLIDLVVTVGWYHLCAAVLGPLHVELEDELRTGP